MTLLDLKPAADKPGNEPKLAVRPLGQPVSTVFADLLPDEVRTRRRLRYLKRRMAFGLIALALIIGLGDALARQQTNSASDDLAALRLRINTLNHDAARYNQVVAVQSETQQITTVLAQAMAGDVPWATLTKRLQRIAPRGLTLDDVDAEVGGDSAAPQTPAASTPGPTVIGSLTVKGTAPSYQAVAGYVDRLVAVPGLTSVTPATAATGGATRTGITFTITAALTAAAQGGRYAPASPAASASSTSASSLHGAAASPATATIPKPTPAPTPAAAAVASPAAAPVGN